MGKLASQAGKGFANRPGGGRNRVENGKKILNRGNEFRYLLITKDLACFAARNELKTNCFLSAKTPGQSEKYG
jgi:hypothetical protein